MKSSVISDVYYDVKTGFGSIAKTLAAARKVDPSIKQADVAAFLSAQEIKQTQKRSGDNSYVPYAPREEYQCDLVDYGEAASRFRYGFVCIDAFSKALVVVPMTGKTAEITELFI